MKIFACCVMVLAAQSVFAQRALDFKGLQIGAVVAPEVVGEKLGAWCGEEKTVPAKCFGSTTIAEVRGDIRVWLDSSGRMQSVYIGFASDEFEGVFLALVEKFGRPTSLKDEQVQNAMGAKFLNSRWVWRRKGGIELVATKYAGSITASSVYFSTPQGRANDEGKSPSERSKDL